MLLNLSLADNISARTAQKTPSLLLYYCSVRVCCGSHVTATQSVHWRAGSCLSTAVVSLSVSQSLPSNGSSNIKSMIKLKRIRWTGSVASMGEFRRGINWFETVNTRTEVKHRSIHRSQSIRLVCYSKAKHCGTQTGSLQASAM
jgi:hypothetical protein